MKISEEKIKKTSWISSLAAFAISVILEIMRQYLPRHTARPTSTEFTLSSFRNLFLIILAVSFTAFIFLILKKRLGTRKAVFYTIYSDSLIGFFIGAIIMSVASLPNVTAVGMTPLESIYYYFLGIFIMLISAAVFLTAMIVFSIISTIIKFKEKKNEKADR